MIANASWSQTLDSSRDAKDEADVSTQEGRNVQNAARDAGTVMVVDDEPRICRFFETVLRQEGYSVLTATNGREAIERATETRPDAILLDIVMPGMDGIATLRDLHEVMDPGVVIMLTAHGNLRSAREAMMLGAYAYITKPFDLELVKSALREGLTDLRGLEVDQGEACEP